MAGESTPSPQGPNGASGSLPTLRRVVLQARAAGLGFLSWVVRGGQSLQKLLLSAPRLLSRLRFVGAVFAHGGDRLKRELPKTQLGKNTPVLLVLRVVQELGEDDATHMAASLSYYAILSLFPLLLGLSALVGLIADSPGRQQEVIDFVVDFLPGSEQFVQNRSKA